MYNLSIFFGPSPVPAQFLFKDKEKAILYHNTIASNLQEDVVVYDDYGQTALFTKNTIHAVILEDMELGEESRIQRGLSQARGQAKANERARTDPTLRSLTNGQGPAILSPGGFGRN